MTPPALGPIEHSFIGAFRNYFHTFHPMVKLYFCPLLLNLTSDCKDPVCLYWASQLCPALPVYKVTSQEALQHSSHVQEDGRWEIREQRKWHQWAVEYSSWAHMKMVGMWREAYCSFLELHLLSPATKNRQKNWYVCCSMGFGEVV